jgi:hypothetical protein
MRAGQRRGHSVIGRCRLAAVDVCGLAKVKALLSKQGTETAGMCGAPFAVDLRKRFDEYGQVIRDAHFK